MDYWKYVGFINYQQYLIVYTAINDFHNSVVIVVHVFGYHRLLITIAYSISIQR